MRTRSWTIIALKKAVEDSLSYRQVLQKLGLKPTGGNYDQLKKYIHEVSLSTKHFQGKAWNRGLRGVGKYRRKLEDILIQGSDYQSFKLKKRLFKAGLKSEKCEECGWAERTKEGYLPLELDHINGDRHDNRIINLRILCPNCHSLKPTHRARNRKSK